MDKNHPFADLFPAFEPDPIWNDHAKQLDHQISTLFESGNLLDAFILAIKGQIEYCSVKRKPGNDTFCLWFVEKEFIRLRESYSDFRYIYILCRRYPNNYSVAFLTEVLYCLTSMRRGVYTPMSQQTKIEIQQNYYNLVLQEQATLNAYLEIIGDEDVIHCKQHQKDNSINR
jgi:hypothetical protein